MLACLRSLSSNDGFNNSALSFSLTDTEIFLLKKNPIDIIRKDEKSRIVSSFTPARFSFSSCYFFYFFSFSSSLVFFSFFFQNTQTKADLLTVLPYKKSSFACSSSFLRFFLVRFLLLSCFFFFLPPHSFSFSLSLSVSLFFWLFVYC